MAAKTLVIDDSPREWRLPDEPGPEVTVRDREGDVWTRHSPGQWRTPGSTSFSYIALRWGQLLTEYGPLTDATGETP